MLISDGSISESGTGNHAIRAIHAIPDVEVAKNSTNSINRMAGSSEISLSLHPEQSSTLPCAAAPRTTAPDGNGTTHPCLSNMAKAERAAGLSRRLLTGALRRTSLGVMSSCGQLLRSQTRKPFRSSYVFRDHGAVGQPACFTQVVLRQCYAVRHILRRYRRL